MTRSNSFSLDNNTATGLPKGSFPPALCISDVLPCYIRTTRTHKESGHVQIQRPLNFFGIIARASLPQIPCSGFSSFVFPHVPITTHQNKQNRQMESDRKAGSHMAHLTPFLSYIFLRRMTITERGANLSIIHTYFLSLIWCCGFDCVWEVPIPHRAREIVKAFTFLSFSLRAS
jgi:hypothetical protein